MEELYIHQMVLIGSTGRNSGKTVLAAALIRKWKNDCPIVGLKITTVQEKDGKCPRGGAGCGVCSSMDGSYEIYEEVNQNANKDTSRLLSAGAEKVYWLKTLKSHIYEGIKKLLEIIPENDLIICESNSLRNVVRPRSFIMLNNQVNAPIKKSAGEVMHKADIIIDFDFSNDVDAIVKKIELQMRG